MILLDKEIINQAGKKPRVTLKELEFAQEKLFTGQSKHGHSTKTKTEESHDLLVC